MTSYLLAGPGVEPVTLVEAKEFLRVEDSVEDGFINTLITAARLHIEGTTGRAMIAQSWRVVCDTWPPDRTIPLPVAPLISLTAVTAYDSEGNATSLALSQFQPETKIAPASIFLPRPLSDAPPLRERGGIEVDYVAGFGSAASDVPANLHQAILTLVGYWFEHRDAVIVAGSGAIVPSGFDRMLSPYKRVSL